MQFISRLLRHLFATHMYTRKKFPEDSLQRIERAIAASEIGHSGQIRFIVETSLSPYALFNHQSPQERALEIFSLYRVWDTQDNNGVLIYLLMADRDFEIIADRNIHAVAGQQYWEQTCSEMQKYLKNNQFESGVMVGIERITNILEKHFPEDVITPNELSDRPIII
jgi:uncharacterized membrane protein